MGIIYLPLPTNRTTMEEILFTEEHKVFLSQIPLFKDLPPSIKSTLLDRLDYQLYRIDKKKKGDPAGNALQASIRLAKGATPCGHHRWGGQSGHDRIHRRPTCVRHPAFVQYQG